MTDLAGSPGSCADEHPVPDSRLSGLAVLIDGLRRLGPDRGQAAVMRLATLAATHSAATSVDASLTMPSSGRYITLAPTSDVPLAADALQYTHGGPCVDAISTDDFVVQIDDLRAEHRWPAFTAAALEETPVLSMASFRLHTGLNPIGALNLYAPEPHAFGPETVTEAEHLAAHTATVLANIAMEQDVRKLQQALGSNRDIGTAIGVLMTRRLITRDQAFTLLQVASQHTNRKLRDLADDVIEQGDLISVDP